jgi:8-oxo-dGTP diphosphatase
MIEIGVRGIITAYDKILLCQNKANKEIFWCLPGGGLEKNESLRGGLQRELKEEFGIDASIGRLLVIHECLIDSLQHIQFFFHVSLGEESTALNIDIASHGFEISNYAFMPVDAIADSTIRPGFLRQLIPKLYASGFQEPISHIDG